MRNQTTLRKSAHLILAPLYLWPLTACNEDETSHGVHVEEPASDSSDAAIDPASMTEAEKFDLVLTKLGFEPGQGEQTEFGMVVEGDILIRTDELDGYIQRIRNPQKAYLCIGGEGTADGDSCDLTATETIDSVNSIGMTFASGVPAAWVAAFRKAAMVWSSQHHEGSPVRISIDAEGKRSSRWNIHVNTTSNHFALASYPAYVPIGGGHFGMRPGSLIVVTTNIANYSQATIDQTALHEVGHTLGFNHPSQGAHLAGTEEWPWASPMPQCADIPSAYGTVMCNGGPPTTSGVPPWPFIYDDDTHAAHILYPHVRTYDLTEWDWNFCSTSEPCDVGEGDCDSDAECKGYLICNQTSAAVSRYGAPSTGDVCAPPNSRMDDGAVGCTGSSSVRCTNIECPCGVGSGDCDNDAECGGGLLCGEDNGPAVGLSATTDVCVNQRPPGCARMDRDAINQSLCTPSCPCGPGEGDCDTDNDCIGSLVCGQNVGDSFGLSATLDLCVDAAQLPNL